MQQFIDVPDGDGVGIHVELRDIDRTPGGDSETAALADRVMSDAFVPTNDALSLVFSA